MSENKYVPGYIEVPGKGRRYRAADGRYYDNHAGPVLNQIGSFIPGLNEAYTNYYNTVADMAGTERRNPLYGSLPTDTNYKREELLLSGQVPGGLPSDLKKTEEPYYRSTQAPDGGNGSGGTDTRTGTKYNSFQEQQDALMQSRVDSYKRRRNVDIDPRTEALIKGIPTNPFSSTQLPYTSDSFSGFSEDAPQMDFGIDPSKVLGRASNVDYSKDVEDLPGFKDGITLGDSFTDDYVSPVNFNAPQDSGDPMLNPDIDSMTAMQMKNRDAGLMYASGQFFAEGANGKSVLVNRGLAKAVRRGDEGAADQLAAYLAGGGIKPQGGVIKDPDRDLMVPPKAEEGQITPTPGEFPSYSSISTADFTNTGGFSPNMTSSLVDDEYDLPSFTKKAGFDFGSKPNTGMFAIDPEVYKVMQDSNNPFLFKD